MNYRLLARLLGLVALLLAGAMAFSLPWAHPKLGGQTQFEADGFQGLLLSMAVCGAVAGVLLFLGRATTARLFRKEAMAVVGLSWVLATILGALPYLLSGTIREVETKEGTPIRTAVTWADAIFESQSGFSTTGATVLTDIDLPDDPTQTPLVPRCILFWRSSTHFLGGLGIIVLFVAILGQGSAGKALMRAEMPGPSAATHQARMQHTAWALFTIYAVLTAVLTGLLLLEGLTWFDALCHAFGTMATGGFSTHNASVGYFQSVPGLNSTLIEMTIVVFMILAGTNFMLLYFIALRKPGRMFADVEWRTYIGVILGVTALIVCFGLGFADFKTAAQLESAGPKSITGQEVGNAIRHGLFQTVSIMTTTGFGTHDFDRWNSFGRGVLFLLMFVGGCAGSTGGGLKVIRHILFLKILKLEIERSFRPTVVRPLRLAGSAVHSELRTHIPIYFGFILVLFVFSWMAIVTIEPDKTWTDGGGRIEDKLIDSASGVAATLNNIGPGLGTVGSSENYANFTDTSKILFTFLMMVGRLEVFVILVLFVPAFWRSH